MLPGPSGPSLLDISGMLYNEVRWAAPTPANGGVGFSLDFYGNNSAAPAYAETDEAVDVFSNKTQFSVSVWISPRSLFPDYFYQDNAGIWQVYMDHDHKLHCLFKSNKNVHVQFDNIGHEFVANLVSDQPNHIVLVYDGAQTNEEDRVKMYRDATALTRSDVHYGLWPAQTGPIVGPLRFGNDFYAPSERQFWGLVDDFRIYNYALSPSEVTGIFLSEDDPTANSGLVVWLPFDEGTGSNFQTANI
jgi:hypothetical protein